MFEKNSLLIKIILGVIFGIALGNLLKLFPSSEYIIHLMGLFSGIFIDYVTFLVPIMVLVFILSGILELGSNATHLLIKVIFCSLICMFLGCLIAYLSVLFLLPMMVSQNISEFNILLQDDGKVSYLTPLMSVTTALVLSFSFGLAGQGRLHFKNFINDMKDIVIYILNNFIVPLVPFYVSFSVCKMTYFGVFSGNIGYFLFLSICTVILHWILIFMVYGFVGIYTSTPVLKMIINMLPAYLTGVGTMSSSSTIPVTLCNSAENDVKEEINDFVIPICATINLSGTAINQIFFSLSIYYIFHNGVFPEVGTVLLLFVNIVVLLVAAPGIPGGAVVATMPILQHILMLSDVEISILYSISIINDAFATGTNVINDGAIAKLISYSFKKVHK